MDDLAGRRVEAVLNLGDCVSGPLWPAETLQLLRRADWPTARAPTIDGSRGPTDRSCRGSMHWLR